MIQTKAPNHILLRQAKLCLDNKRFDDRAKAQSLTNYPSMKSDIISEENNADERRRVFAKSKSTIATINNSDELKYLSFSLFKIFIFNVLKEWIHRIKLLFIHQIQLQHRINYMIDEN